MSRDAAPGRGIFQNLDRLILASSSPRRKALLESVGVEFDVVGSGVDEEAGSPDESPGEQVLRCAVAKAQAVSSLYPASWVLAADTIVVLNGRIFGKPESPDEAARILSELSGGIHMVISAVCLVHRERNSKETLTVSTEVRFKQLTVEEIDAYVQTGEPMDKAGAYGIQGIGAFLVRSINGSYTNVVGLPLCDTLELLAKRCVIAPHRARGDVLERQ